MSLSVGKVSGFAKGHTTGFMTGGAVISIVSLIALIAAASSAVEIKKAESCDKYPKKAWQKSTAVAVLSAVSLLVGIGVMGISLKYKAKKEF